MYNFNFPHITKTRYYISKAEKLGIAQFINTALIALLVKLYLYGSQLNRDGGLVIQVTLIFISNSIVPSLMESIDPKMIMKNIKRSYFINRQEERIQLSQQEANKIFEDRKMDLSIRYSSDSKTLLLCGFYAYLIPVGSLICVFSFIFAYWTNKYNLLRRQSKPFALGSKLPKKMIEIFISKMIVAYSLGCLLFQYILYDKIELLTVIQCGITVLYKLLPITYILDKIYHIQNRHVTSASYQESKKAFTFEQDYDRLNPITKQNATKEYIEFCIQNSSGDQQQKNQILLKKLFEKNKFMEDQNSDNQLKGQNTMTDKNEKDQQNAMETNIVNILNVIGGRNTNKSQASDIEVLGSNINLNIDGDQTTRNSQKQDGIKMPQPNIIDEKDDQNQNIIEKQPRKQILIPKTMQKSNSKVFPTKK